MHKTKGSVTIVVLLSLVLILGSLSLACDGKPAPAPPPSPLLPAQTPPSLPPMPPEPEIPANYTTYTDEAKLFSISYPPDWETALSFTANFEKDAKEVVSSLKSGVPVGRASVIFLAGRLTATGHEPNVSIVVGPIPEGISTHDQMVEAEVEKAKKVFQDYREFSRVKTTVGGREATIVDWEGTLPEQGKRHFLYMIMLVDKTTWVVTCGTLTKDFAEWENDFNAIVRSLRISN